jgi:hypothetical protein
VKKDTANFRQVISKFWDTHLEKIDRIINRSMLIFFICVLVVLIAWGISPSTNVKAQGQEEIAKKFCFAIVTKEGRVLSIQQYFVTNDRFEINRDNAEDLQGIIIKGSNEYIFAQVIFKLSKETKCPNISTLPKTDTLDYILSKYRQ